MEKGKYPDGYSQNLSFPPEFFQKAIETGKGFTLKKSDYATTVGIMTGKAADIPFDLLIKRFNYRGFPDFLLHRIFNGRAKRLWDKNIQLFRMGLPVPCPLQYIEGSFRHKESFFISSVIGKSEKLSHIFRMGLLADNNMLTKQLAETVSVFHLSGAVHGDLKWPNILVQNDSGTYRCFFIDLDQAKLYSRPCFKGIQKDMERFYRFGLQLGAEKWVEKEFLPEYLSLMRDRIKPAPDPDLIKKNALKEWITKGSKKF